MTLDPTALRYDVRALLLPIQRLHEEIRAAVVDAAEQADRDRSGRLAEVAEEAEGDTIYAVDKISEERIIALLEREIAPHAPLLLAAEGLPGGQIMLPRGRPESDAIWRIIIDPIDGTRGIMYQKRSAWILTGVAPNRGPGTNLQDIEIAVQTEIPLVKQHLSDSAWAIRGTGVTAERYNRLTQERAPLRLTPSRADSIAHGYCSVVRFFPGAREELSAIDEEITREALGPVQPGKAHCFEDQYASTGGQLWELMCGRDRFVADLRPLMERVMAARGLSLGLCCHPYDLCTELIAREAGVIVTDERGDPLNAPLKVEPDLCWVGSANAAIHAQMAPLLHAALAERGLLDPGGPRKDEG